jgi:processing peptidase subunit alpha
MLSTMRGNRRLQQVVARHMSSLNTAAPSREASILDGFFRKSNTPEIGLDQEFTNLPELQKPAVPRNTTPQITTLDNGLRVVTADSASPLASMGVFIDSGSRHESPHTNGITNFLEHLAFKSTKSRSDFKIVREMLNIGANVMCSTSREHTVYSADCLKPYAPRVLHTLADVITNHAFDPQEIKAAKDSYTAENQERADQADVQIMEGIHKAAYGNNTVGLSLYASDYNLTGFDSESLQAWSDAQYTAKNMVVGAVGVDHAEFAKDVEYLFRNVSTAEPAAPPADVYTGGESRIHKPEVDPMTHLAVAFETASWNSDDLVPMCVLQTMMGGGGSFSAGGPGKGMYSRLYENVLNRHGWVESAQSFNSIFNDTALFGIYGICGPESAPQLASVLLDQFDGMAGAVDPTELVRAKKQLQAAVNMQLETRGLQLEDMGRQLLIYGKVQSAQDMCKQIDGVSAADIQRVAKTMLKTAPSVASFGNIDQVPLYHQIIGRGKK